MGFFWVPKITTKESKDWKTMAFFLSHFVYIFDAQHRTSSISVFVCGWYEIVFLIKSYCHFALKYRTTQCSSHWLSVNITTTTFHLLHTQKRTHIDYKYLYTLKKKEKEKRAHKQISWWKYTILHFIYMFVAIVETLKPNMLILCISQANKQASKQRKEKQASIRR